MHENDLIMINDIHLMLIPNILLPKNFNARVGIYMHTAFPSSDVLETFPFHQELLTSTLLCDVVGFHVFHYARDFLNACKRIFGICYEIKFRGFITLNYLGRHIIVKIMYAGVDLDYISGIIKTKEYSDAFENFKSMVKDKYCLVSIDNPNPSSGLLLKLQAYKKFLDKLSGNEIILLQIIKTDENYVSNELFEKHLEEMINTIQREYPNMLKIVKVPKCSITVRFAALALGSTLFYLQIREGNCTVTKY